MRLYSILGICGRLYDTAREETETTVDEKLFSSDHLIQDSDVCKYNEWKNNLKDSCIN